MIKLRDIHNKRALTIQEAADYACVSRSTIENWMSKGILPFENLPGRGSGSNRFKRIRKTDLNNFLDQYYQQNFKPNKKKESKELFLIPRNT